MRFPNFHYTNILAVSDCQRLEQENQRLKQIDDERVLQLTNAETATRAAAKVLETQKKKDDALQQTKQQLLTAQRATDT